MREPDVGPSPGPIGNGGRLDDAATESSLCGKVDR